MTMNVNGKGCQKPFRTVSGEYYSGMTKAQATKKDNYKKMVGIDFKDIDTDKNGVLSKKEIINAREKEIKRMQQKNNAIKTAGGIVFGAGIVASEAAVGIPVALAGGAIVAYGESGDEKVNKEIQKTEEYKHQLDTKM